MPSGALVEARSPEGGAHSGAVTIAVRPEHAVLSEPGALIDGTLKNIVYFGTDTHYHVESEGQPTFVIRRQNQPDAAEHHSVGDSVGISFNPGIAQVLRD